MESLSMPQLPVYEEKPVPPLIFGVEDAYLALAIPLAAYWALSALFHLFDVFDLFPQYRLHTPDEVLKRNRVGRWDCLRDVLVQQLLQTLAGLGTHLYLGPDTMVTEDYAISMWAGRVRISQKAITLAFSAIDIDAKAMLDHLGPSSMFASMLAGGLPLTSLNMTSMGSGAPTRPSTFFTWELVLAKAIYYVIYPVLQFLVAMFIVDTWQYFLHRLMHTNKWCYRTFHVRHHRLYAPYAYGALYNHPLEGFVGDTVGAGIAFIVSGMSTKQAILFFTIATIKTVDDHCGYKIPWDPLQFLTSNNAEYHDIHHQSWGMKTNFSQPFFTFWDGFFGTKWVGDAELKRKSVKFQ